MKESTWPASRLVEGVITPTPPGKCVPHTCLCLCSGTKTIALSIEISASNSVSNENTSNAGEDEKQEVPGSTSGAGSTGPWAPRPLPGHWQVGGGLAGRAPVGRALAPDLPREIKSPSYQGLQFLEKATLGRVLCLKGAASTSSHWELAAHFYVEFSRELHPHQNAQGTPGKAWRAAGRSRLA